MALYEWRPIEITAREDEGPMAFDLCLAPASGTLTFPIDVNLETNGITATGRLVLIHVYTLYIASEMLLYAPNFSIQRELTTKVSILWLHIRSTMDPTHVLIWM